MIRICFAGNLKILVGNGRVAVGDLGHIKVGIPYVLIRFYFIFIIIDAFTDIVIIDDVFKGFLFYKGAAKVFNQGIKIRKERPVLFRIKLKGFYTPVKKLYDQIADKIFIISGKSK